jgi:hypothetical protein
MRFNRLANTVLKEEISKEERIKALKSLNSINDLKVNTEEVRNEYHHGYETLGKVGYVETTYNDLVRVFGEPLEGFDKTNAEWYIKFPDGVMANVYDYKMDYIPQTVFPWHVGSGSVEAVHRIASLVKGNPITLDFLFQ